MAAFITSLHRADEGTSIHAQLEALHKLVQAGKVRAVGLSNETPYGVHEFVRLAEQYGLPRVATVQNALLPAEPQRGKRTGRNHAPPNVSLLAYSPLAFGLLTGKYDDTGLTGPDAPQRPASPNMSRPANSAGAARRLWPRHGATARWRVRTA